MQRNVGNQAMHTDLNLMACLEYAVKSLKVCGLLHQFDLHSNTSNLHTPSGLTARCRVLPRCCHQVKTIILCGHYNCGAVRAALQLPHCTPGLVNCWISDIRECRNQAEKELIDLDPEQQLAK